MCSSDLPIATQFIEPCDPFKGFLLGLKLTLHSNLSQVRLAEFYGVSVRVHREPDGTVIVVPSRNIDLR